MVDINPSSEVNELQRLSSCTKSKIQLYAYYKWFTSKNKLAYIIM